MAKNWTSELLGSQLSQGALLLCLNLSLSNKKTTEISKLKEALRLNLDNVSNSKATYGSASFKYIGEEYYQGDIFCGSNEKMDKTLFHFEGRIGWETLNEVIKTNLLSSVFEQCTISQAAYAFQINNLKIELLEEWIETVLIFSRAPRKYKGSVFLDKNSLKIGQKGSTKTINIEPVYNKYSKKIEKFVIITQVRSTSANNFWSILGGNSSTFNNYCATDFLEFLNSFEKIEFVEKLQNDVTKNFEVGAVSKIKTKKNIEAKSPAYKSVRAACTTIGNKLVNTTFSSYVQEIIIEKVKEIIKEQTSIYEYNKFKEELIKILNEEELIRP
jgi:hypothetical protein